MNMNMNKLEEVLATSKLNELIHKKEEDEKNCKIILMILAMLIIAPAFLTYFISEAMRRKGLIKDGDMKLEI